MKAAGLFELIPAEVWQIDWNVNCQPVGTAEATLNYLAPYVFKVAIADHRIVGVEAGNVTFRYKKSHSQRLRTMTLEAMEFIRRFLQHVLPTGFIKVRYYGVLSPTFSVPIEEVKATVEIASGFTLISPEPNTEAPNRHLPSLWGHTPLFEIGPLAEACAIARHGTTNPRDEACDAERCIELRPLSP